MILKDPTLFDWFHLEFLAHFRNYLNAIDSNAGINSLDHVKKFNAKYQCRVNPLCYANCNANILMIKAELESLMCKKHLLVIEK